MIIKGGLLGGGICKGGVGKKGEGNGVIMIKVLYIYV
jgi:hypothetical protein